MTEVELKERIDIETSKEFRIRHEDIYLFLALAIGSFPIHAILLSASKNYPDFRFGIVIALVIFDVLLLGICSFAATLDGQLRALKAVNGKEKKPE